LYWWSDTQLRELRDTLLDPWRAWCLAWGVGGPAEVVCEPAHVELPAGSVQGPGAGVACLAESLEVKTACLMLFAAAAGPAGSMAFEAGREAVADLHGRMAGAVKNPEAAGMSGMPQVGRWSGTVHVRLAAAGQEFHLWLGAPVVKALVTSTASPSRTVVPLTPITQAAGGRLAGAMAMLAGCEIDVGSLLQLTPGDVLPLTHALDEPATVVDASGALICDAHLGSRRGRKAVELARH
jgi:hypothetical protein